MAISKIKKLILRAINNQFVSSSGLILAVNLINAASNYLLIILVSYTISSRLSLWTALTGLITILASPIVGANLEMSRKVSSLEKELTGKGYLYLSFLKKIFWQQGGLVLLAYSVIVLFGSLFFNYNDQVMIAIYWLTGLVLFSQLQSGTSTQFLIGVIETKKAGFAMLFNGVARLLFSAILIFFGFGILALPLGLMLSFVSSLIVASWFIFNLNKKYGHHLRLESQNIIFKSKKELLSSSKTIVSLSVLALILYSTSIISENFFTAKTSDVYAVIFNFGQITHFGSTAFMSVFMAHATRSKNLLEYKLAILVSTAISVFIGLVFGIFGNYVLLLFNRVQYTQFIPLILLYVVFIIVYNAIFITTQFLLAKKAFTKLTSLIISVIAMVIGQLVVAMFLSNNSQFEINSTLTSYILTSLGFAIIILIILSNKVLVLKKHLLSNI